MSVPSMVHRSGDSLIVRSVVSGDALFGSADAVQDSDEDPPTSSSSDFGGNDKDLPECKVKRNYSCALCDFFTQNPRHHLYHLRDVHSEKVRIYECPNCLYASKHFQKLLRHTKMVHGDGTSGGGEITAAATAAPNTTPTTQRHNISSNNNNNNNNNSKKRSSPLDDDEIIPVVSDDLEDNAGIFKCSVCAFAARSRALLSRHEREEHIKTKFFRCTKCTYVTHMKARFTKHVKYHSMPMIKCDMCDFRTPYKWNLDRHCKNHNGKGAFRCSACNFTADIKQSLTVHEMNHHVPPVGQAAGLGVGRRRNKVGASDATAAEEAAQQVKINGVSSEDINFDDSKKSPISSVVNNSSGNNIQQPPTKKSKLSTTSSANHQPAEQGNFGPDFIHPDDIIHHANGNVYIKNKCNLCNFKSAWGSEMAKHEKKVHNIVRETSPKPVKKPTRPIPNLIPIPTQSSVLKFNKNNNNNNNNIKIKTEIDEPIMSQQDMKEICAKSANSSLRDFASLFSSEDVFKDLSSTSPKNTKIIPDLISTSTPKNGGGGGDDFNKKHESFFDRLKEKLMTIENGNLICKICGHESKCLTEQAAHEKVCGKESNNIQSLHPTFLKSTRCPYCRQRCKTSAILDNHLQTCPEAIKASIKNEDESSDNELKIDESQSEDGDFNLKQPHPMENRVFVWNNITVPMDVDIEEQKYVFNNLAGNNLEEKIEDNISLDTSVRTQSPGGSECSYIGQEYINSHHQSSPSTITDKIPTHGNDISVAQHKRVFKCPHCSFWASTASRFHVHIVGHLNKKPFECSLCSYRSNWRWDITKHIKLKSVRDPAHESAKVLMTDETGRRNYTKYNKYLTEIHVSGDQTMETSGGSGTRPKHHDHRNTSPHQKNLNDNMPKLTRAPNNNTNNNNSNNSGSGGNNQNDYPQKTTSGSNTLRPPPPLKTADGTFFDKKRSNGNESKRTLFKCKKCNFRDASREILLAHVKGHYPQQNLGTTTTNTTSGSLGLNSSSSSPPADLSSRGVSPEKDEASVSTSAKGSQAPFRCGHCNQVSNWKHVIQRHCRLKHSGDIRVVSNKNGQEKLEVEEQTDEPDHIDVPQDGTFKCSSCPYSSDNQNDLKIHLINHSPSSDSIMKCHYCTYFVTKKDDMLEHYKLHGVVDPEDFLNKIINNTTNESDARKRFRCLICPYVTNSKSQYTYHKQFHKPKGGQYTCSQCSYNVSKRHLLHQHLKVHGINVTPQKQNGDVIDLEDISDEIEEVDGNQPQYEIQTFPDIPLVWVSKNGKFSKMFKCRYCPHVNLRKVNIQEHEKMHSVREKNPNSSRPNDVEHHCTECNYVCNNAGVLSSHSKVHQGLYGTVHCLVDQVKTDDEQIRELSKFLNPSYQSSDDNNTTINLDEYENAESSIMEIEDQSDNNSSNGNNNNNNNTNLYFCKECPARFLKENEYSIHYRLHGVRLFYKCNYCSYSARQKPHLLAHSKVHTSEYQERTKVLQEMHLTSNNPPQTYAINGNSGELVWLVSDQKTNDLDIDINMMMSSSNSSKSQKNSVNVPLSGTELFQQKSEAQQKYNAAAAAAAAAAASGSSTTVVKSPPSPKFSDPQFGTLMHGNPDFVYPTYLKNGRMKEKRYKCHKCPSAFEKREQYRIHLSLHGSEQRYKCDYCDYSVKYYANYVQHLKKHKMNTEAQEAAAARRPSDELENDEILVEEVTNTEIPNDNNSGLIKLSTGDQQAYKILQQRLVNSTSPVKEIAEDKKLYNCTNCPYVNYRRDAVDNHQRRHISVSGIKNNFTCEHCDYSVPHAHFLREHIKLHFLPLKNQQVDGYMVCDDLKLITNKNRGDEGDENEHSGNDEDDVIFEEKDNEFLPPLKDDIVERFNNNDGEKQFVDLETGEWAKNDNNHPVNNSLNNSKKLVVDDDNNGDKMDES